MGSTLPPESAGGPSPDTYKKRNITNFVNTKCTFVKTSPELTLDLLTLKVEQLIPTNGKVAFYKSA